MRKKNSANAPRHSDDLTSRCRKNGKSVLFSDDVVTSLSCSLPEPICERRRELLPQMLREWGRTDLPRWLSLDTRAAARARIKRVERVRNCARALLRALDDADEERAILIDEIFKRSHGCSLIDVSRSKVEMLKRWLEEERSFLARLAAIAPKGWRTPSKSGRPRNDTAYLVLQDASAIFRWFGGEEPTREVDRHTGKEIGPFFRFANALWPVVFGKGVYGLPAAMKNWEWARSHYGEESALIANINMRHRAWGVYEC